MHVILTHNSWIERDNGHIFKCKLSSNFQPQLQVIAERLSAEEIGDLKDWFKRMDTDNSVTITLDELKGGLQQVSSELMESEIKDLMAAVRI
jgi:Ca2+-binding EF-hand superfamily protein